MAAITGTLSWGTCGRAAPDPYAIDPFRVPYRTAPADPATRWAGFQSRVGTYLPTDPYHFWRFDIKNRAEVQDAFWNVEAVADLVSPNWTGAWPSTMGEVTQAWRDAFMRCLNLQRYYYMGADTTYLEESSDATYRTGLNAAALIEGARPNGFTHRLTVDDMPAGFAYTDQAIFWAAHAALGWTYVPSDINAFLTDNGNPWPGHRLSALNPRANLFALGKSGNLFVPNTEYDPSIAYYATDTTTVYQSGVNFGNPDGKTVFSAPQYDPFTKARFYPYSGYVTVNDLGQGGTIPLGIEFPGAGLALDPSAMQINVTRDGVPVGVNDIGYGFELGWRQSVYFTVSLGFFPYNSPAFQSVDSTVKVTITGLKYSTDPMRTFAPSGRLDDAPAYLAQTYQAAFQPHTITWSFTVFDPNTVVPVGFPHVGSEVTNLSTRAAIGAGDATLIAGFVVQGNEPLRVAIRAQGPSLSAYGIQHAAVNPRISVYDGAPMLMGSNDNWKDGPNWRLVQSYGLNPTNTDEAVAVATLMPGAYSAVVTDPGSSGLGVGIVEVFALDPQSASRLVNVSTRATLGSGEATLIGGFTLQKTTTVVVRTQSPSLAKFGLNTSKGTKLTVVRQSDQKTLAVNTGWNAVGSIGNERFTTDLASYVAGLSASEAAQVLTLPPGAYTALVESIDGTNGVGIVEIFSVSSPP